MIFDHPKGKAKRDEDTGEGTPNHPSKKNKQWRKGSLVATADRKGGRKLAEGTLDHFEKLLGHAGTMLSPSSIYTRTTAS